MIPIHLVAVAAMRGALLLAVCASIAGAQNQAWIRQFGTSNWDSARAVASDGLGGVFVSGHTVGSLGGPSAGDADAWLTRHDGTGAQAWIRQFGTSVDDLALAAASDGAGGVLVVGSTLGSLGGPNAGSGDAWLARYDGAGNQTWIRQFGTDSFDRAYAVASDGAGGVFVSGVTLGSFAGPNAGVGDAWIARHDGLGNQTWLRQLGTGDRDFATAVVPDGAGGVHVIGSTTGSLGGPNAGNFDSWIAHYDGTGNQTWIRQLGTAGSDLANAAAPDGAGGVLVVGSTLGSLGGPNAGSSDAWLARYDGAGNQTWIRQLGTSDFDEARAAASDGAGGVFVAGSTNGSLGGPTAGGKDAWLAAYDGAGNQTWIRQLGTIDFDLATAVVSNGAGGIFASGVSHGDLGGPNVGLNDVWVALYDTNPTLYCSPAVPNSTGQPGQMNATGSYAVVDNDFTLVASQLPLNSFGYFLTSQAQGFVAGAGGSQGNLCLSGGIGRFVAPGQILNSSATGTFSLAVNLTALPTPISLVAVQPGETWNFQAWHRDANPTLTSNFTDAVAVVFQ